jgi:RNA polymerase sigma-70 factor (ECF subfamily)
MAAPKAADEAALNPETWLDEHGDVLFGYAMSRVRDAHTAEELVQETLVAAIAGRDAFAGRSAVQTWLVGILRHKILQHFRRKDPRFTELEGTLGAETTEAQFNKMGKWRTSPEPWGGDPAAVPETEEFRAVLQHCLGRLPARVAEAFLMAEQNQISGENLSKILQTTATNVYVMLHRARAALRQCLERNWFGKGDRTS